MTQFFQARKNCLLSSFGKLNCTTFKNYKRASLIHKQTINGNFNHKTIFIQKIRINSIHIEYDFKKNIFNDELFL